MDSFSGRSKVGSCCFWIERNSDSVLDQKTQLAGAVVTTVYRTRDLGGCLRRTDEDLPQDVRARYPPSYKKTPNFVVRGGGKSLDPHVLYNKTR